MGKRWQARLPAPGRRVAWPVAHLLERKSLEYAPLPNVAILLHR